MPGASIKNEKLYEDLRKQGDSKQKAARISNAAAARGTSAVARKGARPDRTTTGRCRNCASAPRRSDCRAIRD